MSRSKVEMLTSINRHNILMQHIMKLAGIKDNYLYVHPSAIEFSATFLREAVNWIEKIYLEEFYSVMKIRKLLPEATWNMYEIMGDFDDHREVKLLSYYLNLFRKALRTPAKPNFFKKGAATREFAASRKAKKNSRGRKGNVKNIKK